MRLIIVGALGSAVLWITGCTPKTTSPSVTTTSEGPGTEAPAGTTAARNNTALVRFVNADPGEKELDIVSGNDRLFSKVVYKSITSYVEVPRGVTQFKLRAAGGTEDLTTGRRELFPGRHYTLVALRRGKGETRLATLSDNLGLLDPGEVRVRLINATTDIDDLDLFMTGTKNRILHGIDGGGITSFTDMEAGSVDIRPANRPASAQLSNLKVEADRLYTFIVVGTASNPDVIPVVDRTEP